MPVQILQITDDENGLRLDRWFGRHFPGLSHGKLEKLCRTGQVRVDGGRVKANARLEAGQSVRVPPLPDDATTKPREAKTIRITARDKSEYKKSILFEDKDVLVINKPAGLAVQGGTGLSRHLDGFLASFYEGTQRPKLVHRLDRETSGVLVLAKNDFSAAKLSETFRGHTARKYYWALTCGVPKPKQGKISIPLAKGTDGKVHANDEEGKRAVTLYHVVQTLGKKAAFVALWPLTGRTHQLRVHMKEIGTPILGDALYADDKTLEVDGDVDTRQLHLHARRLIIPHPRKGTIDVKAPLQSDMQKSWRFFDFPMDDDDPFADYEAE